MTFAATSLAPMLICWHLYAPIVTMFFGRCVTSPLCWLFCLMLEILLLNI